MSFRLTLLLTALLTTLSLSLSTPFDVSSRRDPILNRGLATSDFNREVGMRGLLPPRIRSFQQQESAALAELSSLPDSLSKYKYLQSIQNSDERLYFSLIDKYTTQIMPLIYTPTVGEACVKWSSMLGGSLQPRGM